MYPDCACLGHLTIKASFSRPQDDLLSVATVGSLRSVRIAKTQSLILSLSVEQVLVTVVEIVQVESVTCDSEGSPEEVVGAP